MLSAGSAGHLPAGVEVRAWAVPCLVATSALESRSLWFLGGRRPGGTVISSVAADDDVESVGAVDATSMSLTMGSEATLFSFRGFQDTPKILLAAPERCLGADIPLYCAAKPAPWPPFWCRGLGASLRRFTKDDVAWMDEVGWVCC